MLYHRRSASGAPSAAHGTPRCSISRRPPASTTLATSTTPAASPSSRAWTTSRRTRSSRWACARSRTSSTAAPRAPIRAPATAPGCSSSCPTSSSATVVDFELPPAGQYGVGVCFLPQDDARRREARGAHRAEHPRRGPARPRLARRAGRHRARRRDRRPHPAGHAPGVRRRRPGLGGRPARLRAQALRHPPHRRARRGPGLLRRVVLEPHRGLEGHAHLAPGPRLLPGPAAPEDEERAGAGPLALLDEHVPELGARPPVPRDRPQRRDQHADGQRELDEGPREPAGLRALRPRPAEGHADHPPGLVGLGDVRQRPRAAHARRPVAAARGDDDDPRGLRRPRRPPGPPQGLLRLPLVPDGAVGRPGRGVLHRRQRHRRDARPQRPAPRPLVPDQGRPRRPGLGGRPARHPRRPDRAPRPPAARQALPRRPRARPDRRRRDGQARGLHAAALRRVVRAEHRPLLRPARGARHADRRRADAHPPAGVRLHAGGPARPHRADGRHRAPSRSARWATTTRCRCCRTTRRRCSATSSSSSRR